METSQKDSLQQHKVLVANRGEIAIRIMRACRKLGVAFTAIFTAEDAASGHVRYARENGGERSLFRVSSYHDANELMSVADQAGCTAVHPGYGFFAEDFRFARRVTKRDRKMIFIGPSWKIIRELGDKINTKRLARSLDVPTVPGSDRPIYDEMEAERIARSVFEFQVQQGIKRPLVLVKASAGGGGMGIEEVYDIDNFRSVYRRIRNYALRQFKDEGVLIEQRITDFNHLEVQIVSDRSGKNPVHFGTRNCSIQSTGLQKRVEVAPGFVPAQMDYSFDAAKVLQDIVHYSLTMARKVGYDNVGTWEWIVTRQGEPFLMEVNTRIQVEHPITEMVTGIDLVRAAGDTAQDCQNYLIAFVPVYSGIAAAGGQTAGGLVYSGMFFAMAQFLATVIGKLLLPVLEIYFCFAACACVWGSRAVEETAALFSKCLHWLLKVCGAVFSFVLGLQSVLAGTADSAALRTGKSVLQGAVPVVYLRVMASRW